MKLLPGMCESGDWVEVPILLSQCLEEADSVKQCALLKKVGMFLMYLWCKLFVKQYQFTVCTSLAKVLVHLL